MCVKNFKQLTILWGSIVIFILTAILHFLYDYTGIFIFSLFSAINESVWEHVKISFFAALFYGIYEYYYLKYKLEKDNGFIIGKAIGLFSIPFFIPTVFYIYTSILGTNYLWIDILISFLAGLISQLLTYNIANCIHSYKYSQVGHLIIIVLIFIFVIFTYYPPQGFEIFIE